MTLPTLDDLLTEALRHAKEARIQKAILVLRENRRSAAAAPRKPSASKSSKAPIDVEALLADL